MSNYKKITTFEKNKKNPFVNELFDIEISARRRILAGRSPDLIVSSEGEIIGHQVFAIKEKVDKEEFTKVFRKGLAAMFDLSKAGIRVFSFIATKVKPNSGYVFFDIDECMNYTGYKTPKQIMTGLAELIESKFIARTEKHYKYFINPTMFFNGSRVAFIKMFEVDKEIQEQENELPEPKKPNTKLS